MAVEIDKLAGPDGGDEGYRLAKFWRSQLEKVRDDPRNKRFIKRGQSIEKRYRDERNRTDDDGARRYNALWANVQILHPAIYGKCPIPIAERRFRDKDVVGRGAAQILERALRNEIEINGFDDAISQAVSDYLLPGRGTVWVRYEPEVEDGVSVVTEGNLDLKDSEGNIGPSGTTESGRERLRINNEEIEDESDFQVDENEEQEKLRETGDRIVRESCPIDYVNWEDFITFPHNARIWKEVTAICKRVYMTRMQMKRRFGSVIGGKVPLKKDDRASGKFEGPDSGDDDDKGEVYEIWSLSDRKVFWIAEGCDYLLDCKDDPLKLENFFPAPRPIFSNATTGTLFPVPDYLEYQDQASQIDELTNRVAMLTKACKVAGVYNAAAKDVQRLLNESVENELIPVDDWAAFAEKGGVAGNISLLPLKEIIGVINELIMVKEKCVEEMDRLTGITDIMRGTTDARETLGGQRLKSNSSGTRLQRRQNDVARFCRDVTRIVADVMAQHFSDQSLIEASGAKYEEGLGEVDFVTMQDMAQAQLPGMPPQGMGGPSPMMGHNGPPPGPMPGAPSAPPMMGGPPPPPQGMPGMPPQGMPMPGMPPQPPQPQIPEEMIKQIIGAKRIMQALQLIRNEKMRGFRVDIEVDSTIYGDSQQEKTDRTQFLTAITGYLQQSMAMSAQVPEIAPLLGKFLQFGVRGFKVGRDLEAGIEDFCDEAVNVAKQKAQQAAQAAQSSPQAITAQASMLKAKTGAQEAQDKSQNEKLKLAMDAKANEQQSQSEQMQSQAEVQRQVVENQGEQANNQADVHMKNMDIEMQQMKMQLERLRLMHETIKMSREAMQPMADIAKGG